MKYSDEQILEVLKDPRYTSNRQRAIALGVTPNGNINKRFDEVKRKYELPETKPSKMGRPVKKKEQKVLKFEDVKTNDRLIHEGKRLIVLSIDADSITLKRMTGSVFNLTRNRFDEVAKEFSKVPSSDPQGGPVTTYYIDPGTELTPKAPIPSTDLPASEKKSIPLPDSNSNCVESGRKPIVAPQFEEIDYVDPAWGVEPKSLKRTSPETESSFAELIDLMANKIKRMADKDIATLEEMRKRYE